jgi:hypothetical protein
MMPRGDEFETVVQQVPSGKRKITRTKNQEQERQRTQMKMNSSFVYSI